ncbi:YlqD family protein [Lentibacillus sediminis]|uniref:YlqD family protein n=1 Tax=Lentibacillus sediminis TaxID=1940529 RepID=UPI000C1C556D|nr:YlqD family protein [Lentibacillus sediminis]
MQIIKRIQIKQIVTEKSKKKLYENFYEHKMRLEQECQQLRFEQRKMQNKAGVSKQEIAQRFGQELDNRKEKMKLIDFKIEQLELLEMGSEITEKEVEALVEVEEGSHWEQIMSEQAIVIKDGIVVRIEN